MSYGMQIYQPTPAETRMAVHTHTHTSRRVNARSYPAWNIGFFSKINNFSVEKENSVAPTGACSRQTGTYLRRVGACSEQIGACL
jgi:hypothetical protein